MIRIYLAFIFDGQGKDELLVIVWEYVNAGILLFRLECRSSGLIR